MIRLIQRKLIIPRGDTGSFSVPTIAAASQGDVAVFTIFDCLTRAKVFQKTVTPQDSNLVVEFTHNDTVNLPPGRYVWDIKFYVNPQYADDELVNGDEINSYYAGYSLPDCEIRETGDDLLTIDGSPETTLTPEALDILSATLTETTTARDIANEAASNANISAETASEKASEAATSAQQAEEYAGQITGLSATAQTLNPGSAATASYDAATGILGLGIPKGATFTPTITADGTISWTNDGSLPNPASTNIHGRGITNIILNNDYTLTIFFNDNTSITTAAIRGATGNGIQSIEKTGTSGLIDTYTITYTDGETSSFTINNGAVPTFSIGTVTEGATAAATITGTPTNPILNLTLPNANVPTNVSAFTNDAGYLTAQDISGKQDTLTFDSTPTQNSTNPVTSGGIYNAIANINTMNIHICAQGEYNAETGVPTIQNPDTSTFYLVPGGEGNNLFIEWAYVNGAWERFGSADVEMPVTDVQIDGTSIINNNIANIPFANATNAGVVKLAEGNGIRIINGALRTDPPTITQIKSATNYYLPITPAYQHAAAFYGLAAASGDSTQRLSANVVGEYTDEAKAAIQAMLDVPSTSDIPTVPVQSVNGKTGAVVLDATDVGAGTYSKPSGGIPASDLASGVIPEVPVQDVQVNGTSILDAQGVANVPIGAATTLGVVRSNTSYGTALASNGSMQVVKADNSTVKAGSDTYRPVVPYSQHIAAFYGLAKAAGHDEKNSTESLGTYTPEAKAAIQHMLGTDTLLAPNETNPFTSAHAIGDFFTMNGKLYRAKTAIAVADAFALGTNVEEASVAGNFVHDVQVNGVSVLQNGVANLPVASDSAYGTVKTTTVYASGLSLDPSGYLKISAAYESELKTGTSGVRPVAASNQHVSTFYGLAKAAGADMKDIANTTVGVYPDAQKEAIQSMLGIDNLIASRETDYIADKAYAVDDLFMVDGKLYKVIDAIAENGAIVVQNDGETVSGANAIETRIGDIRVKDIQVNGTSIVTDGVANVPVSTSSTLGVMKVSSGLNISSAGSLYVDKSPSSYIKSGENQYRPIVPYNQHESTFYGLAKAAGDATQSQSNNAVGTYTDNAKASIKSMLGIVDGSTGTVDISDTTPTITAVENTRYVCGEVSTLSFTPPASGISIVRFTSGTTATVLTIPNTVKFPEWFDPTSLETDTIYEICVTDGVYGAVMSWAL